MHLSRVSIPTPPQPAIAAAWLPPSAATVCAPPTSYPIGQARLLITEFLLLSGWKDGHITHTWPAMALYHLVFGYYPEGPPCDLVGTNRLPSMRFEIWTQEESVSTGFSQRSVGVQAEECQPCSLEERGSGRLGVMRS